MVLRLHQSILATNRRTVLISRIAETRCHVQTPLNRCGAWSHLTSGVVQGLCHRLGEGRAPRSETWISSHGARVRRVTELRSASRQQPRLRSLAM